MRKRRGEQGEQHAPVQQGGQGHGRPHGEPVDATLRQEIADGVHGPPALGRDPHFLADPVVSVIMPRLSMPMRFNRSSVSMTVP